MGSRGRLATARRSPIATCRSVRTRARNALPRTYWTGCVEWEMQRVRRPEAAVPQAPEHVDCGECGGLCLVFEPSGAERTMVRGGVLQGGEQPPVVGKGGADAPTKNAGAGSVR